MFKQISVLVTAALITFSITGIHLLPAYSSSRTSTGPNSVTVSTSGPSSPGKSTGSSGPSTNPVSSGTSDKTSTQPAKKDTKPLRTSPMLDGAVTRSGARLDSCGFAWTCGTLSTKNANDIVIVVLFCYVDNYGTGNQYCNQQKPTVTDTAGLSFALHQSQCYTGQRATSCVWDYYAVASSPLQNDNITNANLRMFAFALAGADTQNSFDPKLPIVQHCYYITGGPLENGQDCTVNFSTSDGAHDFLFTSIALYDSPTCAGLGTQGWELLWGGSAWAEVDFNNTAPQDYSFTCRWPTYALVEMVDGIQGAIKDQSQG